MNDGLLIRTFRAPRSVLPPLPPVNVVRGVVHIVLIPLRLFLLETHQSHDTRRTDVRYLLSHDDDDDD